MRRKECESDSFRRKTFVNKVSDRKEIAKRFTHFFTVDHYPALVHPIVYEFLSVRGLGLRDLAFVVRELIVLPSCMKIQGFAEVLFAHRAALKVPTRKARSPRGVPFHDVRLVLSDELFPYGEIESGTLVLVHFHPCSSLKRIESVT